MFQKKFGNRLKYARIQKELSCDDVAEKIHVSSGKYYAHYETGAITPPPETMVELCKIYGVTPNFLYSFDLEEDIKDLATKITFLPSDDIEFLTTIVNALKKKSDHTMKVIAEDT